ncbi:Mur ligase family protein [Streptococcus pneumoniae]|uniref:Mur ligase family protein n=1 Tax=Streptococcus pneumoniae TaxID=1313 RepID=UPI00344CB329
MVIAKLIADVKVYYERYVVIQPGVKAEDGVAEFDLLSEEEYLDILETLPRENQLLDDTDPNKFIAKMGAEAIYDLLSRLDLDALSYTLRHRAGNDASQQRKNEALKRLQVVESFRASRGRNKPEWMIVRIVPVIPPELRPLRLTPADEFGIFELGANHKGEIDYTSGLVRPNVALVNNVGSAHLEGFGSQAGVAQAKSEIFNHLQADGTAIINADDAFADFMSVKARPYKQLSFSQQDGAAKRHIDVIATGHKTNADGCYRFMLSYLGNMCSLQEVVFNSSVSRIFCH